MENTNEQSGASLEMIRGNHPGHLYPLSSDTMVLGRHPTCAIVLEDASVSRQHATLTTRNAQFFIEDHESRNKTFLNDHPIPPHIPTPLHEGDLIRICSLVFRFHERSGGVSMVEDAGSGSLVTSRLDLLSDAGVHSVRLSVNAETKLRAMMEISHNLGQAVRLDDVLPKLLDNLFTIFPQADRGFLGLLDPQTHKLIPKTWKSRVPTTETIRISRTIVGTVIESKQAILSTDAASDDRFDMAASIVDIKLHSIMCTPLVTADGRVLGIIQLDSTNAKRTFTPDDLEVLGSVASQATVSVENAQLHETALQKEVMRREMELGQQVQHGFLPLSAPEFPGYRFFNYYEAANQLGGDYFDYIPLSGGRLAVALADVSGKGISAALFMAKLSAEVRYNLAIQPDLKTAMYHLNNAFCSDRRELEGKFITFVVAILDPYNNAIQVANAGHMNPIVRRPDGETLEICDDIVGPPLGVIEDYEYTTDTATLNPNEYLFLYTDGLCDAENAERIRYGYPRIYRVLARTTFDSLETSLLGDVRTYIGRQPHTDDMCLVAFERDASLDPSVLEETLDVEMNSDDLSTVDDISSDETANPTT